MDLRRQLTIVRAHWRLIVACALLAGVAAFAVSSILPKSYHSEATLIVGQGLTSTDPNYNELLASQQLTQTYVSVATQRKQLEGVIAKLRLATTPEDLAKTVNAQAAATSTLITISADDPDPQRAAAVANALAQALLTVSPAIQGTGGASEQFIQAQLQATQSQVQQLQGQISALTAVADRTLSQDQELQALNGQLGTARSTYATLLSASSNNAANLLSIIQPAVAPVDPASPRPLLNTLLALIVGALIAIGVAFLLDYLDDSLKTSEAVEETLGLPTLGAIVQMRASGPRSEIYHLVALLYPRSPVTEAYRTLRTNVEFASVDAPVRTLLVTSSVPGEGKTTTAANLAVTFAQAGRRVLLVDADLRKPGLHRILDLPNQHGLTTLLGTDQVGLESLIQGTEQDGLAVLTTGPLPANPAELLGSQRMRAILEHLTGLADLVIIDSPPLQAVTDAAILAAMVDGALLVVDGSRTRRGAVQMGREALAKADAHVLGVVLNRLSERVYTDYYHYYGAYGVLAADNETAQRRDQPPAVRVPR